MLIAVEAHQLGVGLRGLTQQRFVISAFEDGGQGYKSTDTIQIVDSGGIPGSGATATPVVGPSAGTYPGAVAYFQQRRVYAYTLNKPDTYFATRIGSYNNMDQSAIPLDSEAEATSVPPES